jgi:hypothetical protein
MWFVVAGVVAVLVRMVMVVLYRRKPVAVPRLKEGEVLQWMKTSRSQWLKEDEALVRESDHWTVRREKNEGDLRLTVRSRDDPSGDPNWLFSYYDHQVVELPLEVTTALYGSWVDLAQNWTKEQHFEKLLLESENVAIWFQFFLPPLLAHICGAAPRALVAAYTFSSSENGPTVISNRSVPKKWVSSLPRSSVLLMWHGGFLLHAEGAQKTSIVKIDRENQGGWLPTWLMNHFLMVKYLNEESTAIVKYIKTARKALIERYNKNQ